MPKLLGRAPNQVPTNADLGTMAFQDREGINVNNAIVANLAVTGATSITAPLTVANSSTSNVAFFAANGNVGIGTNAPTTKLMVNGGSARFVQSGQGDLNIIHAGLVTSMTAASGVQLALGANGVDQIRINGANVGIGNTAPDAKLAVTGTANISGNVTFGGTSFIATSGNTSLGNTTVTGNLTVTGTTTFINTTQLNVGDNIITLNADLGAVAPSENAGFEVNRGTSANVSFLWDETTDQFVASNANNGLVALSTEYSVTMRPTDGSGPRLGFGSNTAFDTFMVIGAYGSTLNNIDNKNRNLSIYSSTTNVAFFAANGNVGIGLTNPGEKFVVTDNSNSFKATAVINNSNTSGSGAEAKLHFVANGFTTFLGQSPSGFTFLTGSTGNPLNLYGGTGAGTVLGANASANIIYLVANGNVGIGNSSPTNRLVVAGNTQITTGDLRIDNGSVVFGTANITPAIVKPTGNTSTAYRLDVGSLGGPSGIAAGAFWNGLHLGSPGGIANSTLGNAFPRMSMFYSYASNTAPTDLTFNMWAGNDSGLGTAVRLYSITTAGSAGGIDIAANGNVGIGNTAPADKLSIEGNIRANNLRRYTATRTLTTTANDTVEIGTLFSQHGAHSLMITVQVTDSGFSVAKQYQITSYYNATGSAYRRVLPVRDTGPLSSNDFDLEAYHNNDTLGLRLRRTGGSTAAVAEVMIDDLLLQSEGSGQDFFTPLTGTASAVAAVTDIFPGNRLYNTGAGSSNSFIVVANTTVNAITANNTNIVFNLPVAFNSFTTMGSSGQASLSLTTSATTANQVLNVQGSASWRSAKYFVQVTSGSAYQATEITLIHDGTNVYKSEYGQVFSGAVLATFDADISGGNIRLLTTPTNAVTTYRGVVTLIIV